MTKPTWTPTRIEMLKILWAARYSASKIAREIGGDVTKNAVIGKARRLDLAMRGNPVKPRKKKPVTKTQQAAKQALHVVEKRIERESKKGGIALLDAKEHHCRYPYPGHYCCGKPIVEGSYCREHADLCFESRVRPLNEKFYMGGS